MAHGHRIAREMEQWWAAHGGRHDHPEWIAYIEDFRALLAAKLTEMSEEHDNEGRFGMSKAGGCTRAAALKFLGYDSAELTGSTRATFAIGHVLEVKALATLRACGYPVRDAQMRLRIDPFMSSATDGIVTVDGEDLTLSVKTIGYKMSGKRYSKGGVTWTRHGFAALPIEGFRAEQPGHWAQMQAEMHASGLRAGLIVYIAKDMVKAMEADPIMQENGSLTFYVERAEYDPQFCGAMLEIWGEQWRSVLDLNPGVSLYYTKNREWVTLNPSDADGNKQLTGTYDPCSYCDLREPCTVAAQLRASLRRSA